MCVKILTGVLRERSQSYLLQIRGKMSNRINDLAHFYVPSIAKKLFIPLLGNTYWWKQISNEYIVYVFHSMTKNAL